jgi:ubiquinone/menaquinone biosynthesis C-methylase UbiE
MKKPYPKVSKDSTSWEPVQKWYRQAVGEEGHYYHKQIILPKLLKILNISGKAAENLLDLGCGQGILARHLPKQMHYTGVDIAPSLIKEAKRLTENPAQQFIVGDASKPLVLPEKDFTHATIILALQNIEHPLRVFQNASKHLKKNGQLVIVLNHPCFRILRQSSWGIDHERKIQYRRIDRYFSPLKIPIQAHPSKGQQSPTTMSFHYPLNAYFSWLKEAGFMVEGLEEWCSDKISTGSAAKMENRSRDEFPLFLTLIARKTSE